MKGTSLRSRLLLSYIVLVFIVLTVIAVGVLWSLTSSPILYRTVTQRLRLVSDVVSVQLEDNPPVTIDVVFSYLYAVSSQTQLRIGLLATDGTILFDSGISLYPAYPSIKIPGERLSGSDLPVYSFTDSSGGIWFYTSRLLSGGKLIVLVATQRPRQVLRTLFREELSIPTIIAGLIALFVAILFSLILASWITRPLKQLVLGAQSVASGKHTLLPLEGPLEVKKLSEAFNEMSSRVFASQQSQRDFVANVSHELKTPITSIQGFAQAIVDGTVSQPEEVKQAASVMYTEANRMHRLVMDLLTLARLEAGTADLEHTSVDLCALLQHTVEHFQIQAQKQGIVISYLSQPVPLIIGDGDRLMQVFANIIDNALKYTPKEGRIIISSEINGQSINIRISDTGRGIPREVQERIFERFYQLDVSRRGGATHGVGLGLSLIHISEPTRPY